MGVVLGQNLGQIRSNVVKKVPLNKETGIINNLFSYFTLGKPFKAKRT